MPRVKRSIVERNAFLLLEFLASRTSGSPSVAIVSHRAMAHGMGLSHTQVRHLVRLLIERGCIQVTHRYAEDGGELANAHRITRVGRKALRGGAEQWISAYEHETFVQKSK